MHFVFKLIKQLFWRKLTNRYTAKNPDAMPKLQQKQESKSAIFTKFCNIFLGTTLHHSQNKDALENDVTNN